MSVKQTHTERRFSGLLILFLLVIGTNRVCKAQGFDYPNPGDDPLPDATLESPEPEEPELPTLPEGILDPNIGSEIVTDVEDALETDLPLLEEDKPEDGDTAPDSDVQATLGGDTETDAPVIPVDVDGTPLSEPESDAPSKTSDEPDATAPAEKEVTGTLAEDPTQPEPEAQAKPIGRPKDKKKKKSKKKKKKKKKKTPGKKKSPHLTTTPIEPQPVERLTEVPIPVERLTEVPIPVERLTEVPIPVERLTEWTQLVEPVTEKPKPVEPKTEKLKPVEPKTEKPKPVEPKTEKPKPVEPEPTKPPVEKKPEEPVTQGPCIDIYTTEQKRQACSGEWRDPVRILNLQVDKLKTENEKLWMQVTEMYGKIKYSRSMISESHLSTNAWKKRVAFPHATSDQDIEDVKDCSDALSKGHEKPGVYLLDPDSPYNVRALCANGWTVVQRRYDGTENFNRDFDEYVAGFGNFSSEFILGLENLHLITESKPYTLRIDVKGSTGKWYYAVYDDFSLADEQDQYRLLLGNMTAGNFFDGLENGRDQQFSTYDRDNDEWGGGNCAEHYGGGWWSNTCNTNLNQRWCQSGCLQWDSKRVISSIMRIKPSDAVVAEDVSENPNPGGLTLDEPPA